MKEYELLYKYRYGNQVEAPFEVVSMAIFQKRTTLLNIDASRAACNEVFDYIEILKRFNDLNSQINDKIDFDDKEFSIDKNKFQTLDEVERAIKNKAFL